MSFTKKQRVEALAFTHKAVEFWHLEKGLFARTLFSGESFVDLLTKRLDVLRHGTKIVDDMGHCHGACVDCGKGNVEVDCRQD